MESGEWRPPGGFVVNYTMEEWDDSMRGVEVLDGIPPDIRGPVVLGVPVPEFGGFPPGGPGMLAIPFCPAGCVPWVGPGPDDAPGHVWCRCEPPDVEEGGGSITVSVNPLDCGLRLTSRGIRCTGLCPAGETCRRKAVNLNLVGPHPFWFIDCDCR